MEEIQILVKIQEERKAQKHLRDLESRRLENDRLFGQRQQELDVTRQRIQMQQDLVAQAIEAGTADASVLISLLEQATEQEYARANDAKVQARAGAQGARYAVKGSAPRAGPGTGPPSGDDPVGCHAYGSRQAESSLAVSGPTACSRTPIDRLRGPGQPDCCI